MRYFAVLILFSFVSISHAVQYTTTDLSSLGFTTVIDINNNGDVLGTGIAPDSVDHQVILLSNNVVNGLGIFTPVALNDQGHVVGFTSPSANVYSTIFYSDAGSQVVGSFRPRDINNSDQITGYRFDGTNNQAVLYDNGVLQDLGTLGVAGSTAVSINNAGVIIGSLTSGESFIFETGAMKKLYLSAGTGCGLSYAFGVSDINDFGKIVGWVRATDGSIGCGLDGVSAFSYQNNVTENLGIVYYSSSDSYEISNTGQIILSDFIGIAGVSVTPAGLNDLGQIIGSGFLAGPYLFTPDAIPLFYNVKASATVPSSAFLGNSFNYNLVVTNTGQAQAQNAVLDIEYSDNLLVDSASTDIGACAVSTNKIQCEFGGLIVGGIANITVNAVADHSGQASFRASLVADGNNVDPANNTDIISHVDVQPVTAPTNYVLTYLGAGVPEMASNAGDVYSRTGRIRGGAMYSPRSVRFLDQVDSEDRIWRGVDINNFNGFLANLDATSGNFTGSEESSFLSQPGLLTRLPTTHGPNLFLPNQTTGRDINNVSVMVGGMVEARSAGSDIDRAIMWYAGKLTGLPGETAIAVNDNNQSISNGPAGTMLWQDGRYQNLGLFNGNIPQAVAINDVGQITGTALTASGETQAFIWQNNTFTDIGSLGGTSVIPSSMNDSGQIVGRATLSNGDSRAFSWLNGVMTDLGVLAGSNSGAISVNASGQVLGWSETGTLDFSSNPVIDYVVWNGSVPTRIKDLLPADSPWNFYSNSMVNGEPSSSSAYLTQSGSIVAWSSGDTNTPSGTILLTPTDSVAQTDLSASLVSLQNKIAPYESVTMNLTVTNHGLEDATGVTVNVHMHIPGSSWYPGSVDIPGGVCYAHAGVLFGLTFRQNYNASCVIDNVPAGSSVVMTLAAVPDADFGAISGTITAKAAVSSRVNDAQLSNNVSSTTVEVGFPIADLAITMQASSEIVSLGDTLVYTATITNNGPDASESFYFYDGFPFEVTFESINIDGCRLGNPVDCYLPSLASGASITVVMETVVSELPFTGDRIINLAEVFSDGDVTDPQSNNNRVEVITTVIVPKADLAITLADITSAVNVGDSLSFVATITNNGPETATGVALNDFLPVELTFVSSDANCTVSPFRFLACSLEDLVSGASTVVTLTAEVNAYPSTGSVSISPSVSGDRLDPVSVNNNAAISVEVTPPVDLAVSMTASPNPVRKGAKLTYTINITNDGLVEATDVVLSDILPSDIVFESVATNQGSCSTVSVAGKGNKNTNVTGVNCELGNIQPAASATVVIVIKPQAPGDIINGVSVVGAEQEGDLSNNSANVTTVVQKGKR